MAGNPHPVFQDGVAVQKANARTYLPLRLGNPDALRALDGSTFWLCYIQTQLSFFYRDTSDTTSADNGTSVIVDGGGYIWKVISSGAGIAIGAAGPVADRGDFDSEDPGFTYFGTDTELLYVRLTGGGWSDGSTIIGPEGPTSTVPGPANSLEIGTVTEGPAAATITGTAPSQTLNLTLPKGDDGDQGPAFSPNEVVPDLAGRDTFDAEAKNFAVLVESDSSNDDLPTLYFKESATSGEWSTGFTFSGGGSFDTSDDYTVTGQWTFDPASGDAITVTPAAASTDRGFAISQSGPTSGSQGTGFNYNTIAVSSDAADVSGNANALDVTMRFGGSNAQGQRVAVRGAVTQTAAMSASNSGGNAYAGVSGEGYIASSDNGTDTTTNAKGGTIGLYGSAIAQTSATNLHQVVGLELNTAIRTGCSSRYMIGARIVPWADSVVDPAEMGAAIQIGTQGGGNGWSHYGIVFDSASAGVGNAFSSGATIIGTKGSTTVTNGIDFSSATISGSILKAAGLNLGSSSFLFGSLTAYSILAENGSSPFTPALQVQSNGAGATASITRWSANGNQGRFVIAKSRGSAIGTRGIVQSGDVLGTMIFSGDDGTNFVAGATIAARVSGTPGTSDMPTNLVFGTTADGSAVATENMVLDSGGSITLNGAISFLHTAAIPAGGTANLGLLMSTTSGFGVFFGSGAPTLSAAKGSIYLRSDGSSASTRMYVNTDGSTGWTNVTTAT